MIELHSLSAEELEKAAWPALDRYRSQLDRNPVTEHDRLRLKRHQSWLRAAFATRFDKASAKDVCYFWSKAAEQIILEAWSRSGLESHGYALLALGKLGAEELNLSSDVDLILVRSDDVDVDTKGLRAFQSLLSDYTEFGFALRVDFNLRPDGASGSIIPSLSEFEYHYGYHGEMWERLAYVRMRGLAGSPELKESISTFIQKFSYRRHLDYTVFDELKNLRAKIRREKFDSRPGTFHLKLGEGGIRELELFVHALQVIHGGRHASLRTNSTTKALEQIQALQILPKNDCEFLIEAYWYLRTLENRIHAFDDQQTYLVDLETGHPALSEPFAAKLTETCARVKLITTSLFGEGDRPGQLPLDEPEQIEWLTQLGFSENSRTKTWPELLGATAVSKKSDRDEEARLSFLKGFVETLAREGLDRDLGLSLLLDFVKATRAKASFFTSLNRETRVRDDLARLFSISPYLGSILSSRPELVDEFILRKLPEPSHDMDIMLEELAERRLLSELIAANQFLAEPDLYVLGSNLTENADAIAITLLDRLKQEYGPSNLQLVALGKWGGRELGLRSDLDFIFVVPNEPTANDQKIARRFLARMTEPHRGGSIYAVDMRLRPSGHAGPILVSEIGLRNYIEGTDLNESSAAAWERQAYLRARPLGELGFQPGVSALRRGVTSAELNELKSIRDKLFSVSQKTGELDLKLIDGGLADIEFTAQIGLLTCRGVGLASNALDPATSSMIQYLEGIDETWMRVGPGLREHYDFLRRIEQLYQLTTSQSGSKIRVKSDEFKRLALVLRKDPLELEKKILDVFNDVASVLDEVRAFSRR